MRNSRWPFFAQVLAEKKNAKFSPVRHAEHNGERCEFASAKNPNGNSIGIPAKD